MKPALVLISLFLVSCLPDRLVPYDFTIEKNNSEAYIEVDSITISLKNLEIKGDHSVFGMEIENNRTGPVIIDPDKVMKYAHYLSYLEDEKKKLNQEVTSAMTPTQISQFFEAKKKEGQAAAVFLFLVGTAISAYDAIKDEEDNSGEYRTKKDEKKSLVRDVITSTSLIATDILTNIAITNADESKEELRYLPKELFDREVINPGESYYGKILFRKAGELQKFHRIVCPIEGNNFLFDFRKASAREKRFLYEQTQ